MIKACCQHDQCKKDGKHRNGQQRYKCILCGARFTKSGPKPLGDMRINMKQATTVLRMLLEGVGINATSRLSGVSKPTILDLLVMVGERAMMFWNDRMRGLECDRIEIDEVWGFVGMKEKTRERLKRSQEFGDAYTFTAIHPVTKIIIAFHVGKRTPEDAEWFCDKLADATCGRAQITTDGFKPYCLTVPEAFRHRADFAQLIKIFSRPSQMDQRTYSPTRIEGIRSRIVAGNPDEDLISTSMVERSNLTWRMRCRRMTRLTNGHSKLWRNHEAGLALTFLAYNFVTVHSTLKTTPAVVQGLTDHPWTMEELLGQLANYV